MFPAKPHGKQTLQSLSLRPAQRLHPACCRCLRETLPRPRAQDARRWPSLPLVPPRPHDLLGAALRAVVATGPRPRRPRSGQQAAIPQSCRIGHGRERGMGADVRTATWGPSAGRSRGWQHPAVVWTGTSSREDGRAGAGEQLMVDPGDTLVQTVVTAVGTEESWDRMGLQGERTLTGPGVTSLAPDARRGREDPSRCPAWRRALPEALGTPVLACAPRPPAQGPGASRP